MFTERSNRNKINLGKVETKIGLHVFMALKFELTVNVGWAVSNPLQIAPISV
jgi:hypothetical protein